MKKRHSKVACAVVSISLLALSACSTFQGPMPIPVMSDKQRLEVLTKKYTEKVITIKNGTPINDIVQIYRNAGIPSVVSSKMDVSSLRYTGPDLDGVNAIDALQVITGLTILDYSFDHRSGLITIVPAKYHKHNLPAQLGKEDWDILLEAANQASSAKFVDKEGNQKTVYLAAVLDDKQTNTLSVAGPYHTRSKISEMVKSYSEQLKSPDSNGVLLNTGGIVIPSKNKAKPLLSSQESTSDNVRVGTVPRVPKFN